MEFRPSQFGQRLLGRPGILELMDDLGEALTTSPDMRMMGGGNPAYIPAAAEAWRRRVEAMASDGELDRALVNYDGPAGSPAFRRALADCLNREYGWALSERNVCVTNGGQTAFFALFNLLAGPAADTGQHRRVLLPLAPEYIGYADQGIADDLFRARPAHIEERGDHEFKYRIDFDGLEVGPDIAALCASRPTNPSGNVLTDDEVARLAELARGADIPLIIDNAYGHPFPGAIFTEARPFWDEGVILTMSLSKVGLPGTRTGIVVAAEPYIEGIAALTAVAGLANGNLGQAIARPMLEDGSLLELSRGVVAPFYRERGARARAHAARAFAGSGAPYRLHVHDGAFFLWFWFPDLPVSSRELYARLKARKVLVVPGEYFFFGLENHWQHSSECIRVTFSQPEEVVREGLEIIADEVARIYRGG